MQLQIIALNHTEFYKTNWIETHTPTGNIVIQSGHAPIIFALVPHKDLLFELQNGETKSIYLQRGGLAEVSRDLTKILINQEINKEQ